MDLRAMECAATEAVWLRLVRGGSLEPVRMLPADIADGAVSVGAADSCDWQIEAEDMPPVAFFLRAIAGSLFVRAAGPAELRVDGQCVGSIWVPVERGARLTIGGACIEVGLAGRSRRAQHAFLERVFDGPVELDARAPDAWRASEGCPPSWRARDDAYEGACSAGKRSSAGERTCSEEQPPYVGASYAGASPHTDASLEPPYVGTSLEPPYVGASLEPPYVGASPHTDASLEPPYAGASLEPPHTDASLEPPYVGASVEPPYGGASPHTDASFEPPYVGASFEPLCGGAWPAERELSVDRSRLAHDEQAEARGDAAGAQGMLTWAPLHHRPAAAGEQLWSATIFGAEEAEDAFLAEGDEGIGGLRARRWGGSAGLWIAGSLVACAYGCWVLLLDYF